MDPGVAVILGAAITLTGVLVTQLFAYRQANKREALAQTRFQAQLGAERERLDRQQAHDRELHDQNELRQLVDDAALANNAASRAFAEARDALVRIQGMANEDWPPDVQVKLDQFRQAVGHALSFTPRLVLRLGRTELIATFVDVGEALDALDRKLPLDPWPLEGVELAEVKELTKDYETASGAFLAAGHAQVASQLPGDSW